MKHMTNHICRALCVAMAVCAVSCAKAPQTRDTVGVLLRNDTDTFLQSYKQSLEEAAQREGIALEIYPCNDDPAIQIDQLKTMLLNGIKYFVILPVNTDMTEQITKIISSQGGAAAFSNISPSVDALKVGQNFYYASSPESAAGMYQAQILDEYFKKHPDRAPGKVLNLLYLNGEWGHPAQIYRKSGLLEALGGMGYTVNIVAEAGANWIATTAKQALDNWLPQYDGQFNAVVAQNDAMALGAIQSLLEYGYTDDPRNPASDTDGDGTVLRVPVLGVDATDDGRASMGQNLLYATVLQDAKSQAETALELVWECRKNGTAVNYKTSAGISGATAVTEEAPVSDRAILQQCYVVPFVPVTK